MSKQYVHDRRCTCDHWLRRAELDIHGLAAVHSQALNGAQTHKATTWLIAHTDVRVRTVQRLPYKSWNASALKFRSTRALQRVHEALALARRPNAAEGVAVAMTLPEPGLACEQKCLSLTSVHLEAHGS